MPFVDVDAPGGSRWDLTVRLGGVDYQLRPPTVEELERLSESGGGFAGLAEFVFNLFDEMPPAKVMTLPAVAAIGDSIVAHVAALYGPRPVPATASRMSVCESAGDGPGDPSLN
jgi:hypothetical protein